MLTTACPIVALALVSSCGQVTESIADNRDDSDAAATPSDAADESLPALDAALDVPSSKEAGSDAGATCTADEMANAQTILDKVDGVDVPATCTSCLVSSCCGYIDACALSEPCTASMKCIFNCQKAGNEKTQCLKDCKPYFSVVAGPCAEQRCSSECQLD